MLELRAQALEQIDLGQRVVQQRLLLRDVTATSLPLLCLPPMELDFVQLRWSPDLMRVAPAMLQAGAAEWVLSQADDADAVQWGRNQGFALFQGRAVAVTA